MNVYKDLSSLRPGQCAAVQALSASGPMRRRLQDIGLIQGTTVECLGASPLGDPAAYLVRGAVIALRGQDAASVQIGLPSPACCQNPARPFKALPAGQEGNVV